jgi:hypothetical protein
MGMARTSSLTLRAYPGRIMLTRIRMGMGVEVLFVARRDRRHKKAGVMIGLLYFILFAFMDIDGLQSFDM